MKYLALFLLLVGAMRAQSSSPCDLNADGVVNIVDVQIEINEALGLAPCTVDLNTDGTCNVADVQLVINAALGGACNASMAAGPAVNTVKLYEVDAVTQTDRPITIGRMFAQGEIAQCPQPMVGNTPVANYQADVKNRWADGSVKFAIISFTQTLGARSSTPVSFQNAGSCNNLGYLTQTQMVGFNSGNWGAEIDVTANGVTKTANAKTMLSALSFRDCQLSYWLQGPVVTQVIVQDCTPTFTYDFGWQWNGSTMANTTAGQYQSLHPIFILSFYPGSNNVKVDYILENMWSTKLQDQQYSVVLSSGNPLTQVYSHGLFTHIARTRWRKTFWSGGAPNHLRIDHNFRYLISTKAFPNYDPAVSVNPTADYTLFAAGDKGDIGGAALAAGWGKDYAGNNEGAPMQREDLEYLYNMGSCGTTNSACGRAWDILTGEVDASPTNVLIGVAGGAGMWNNQGNVPYHLRESRTTGSSFYCPGFASKDATPSATCGGAASATGRPISRHAHPTDQWGDAIYAVTPVGTHTLNGWQVSGCSHWLDYSYTPYLLTGDYYYLDEEYQGASYCLAATNADNGIWSSNGFYAYVNPSNYTVTRNFAWAMQTVGRAAFIAPDNTPESSLYTSMLASNIEVLEGFMKITGTSLTPTSANTGCSSYNAGTANRWDWGRCTVAQNLAPALHNITSGECPISGDVAGYVDGTKASEFESLWQYWFVSVALSHLHELGLTQVHSVVTQTWQRLIEMVKDPTFNPYLIAYYEIGIKGGVQACNNSPYPSANPFFTSWSQVKAALPPGGQTINTFNHGVPGDPPNANFACADHGYSLLARAAGTYITNMNSGSLSGIDAWSWIKSNVPYFSTCGDRIIKYALAPR